MADDTISTAEMRYPNRLRELRKTHRTDDHPTTIRDVAKALYLSASLAIRHENGQRGLNGYQIEQYAMYYGVTPFELFVPRGYYLVYDDKGDPVPNIEGEPVPDVADDIRAIMERSGLLELA